MKNYLKNFLYFSRTERRGILMLCTLILLVLGFTVCHRHFRDKSARLSAEDKALRAQMQEEYAEFMASLHEEAKTRPPHTHSADRYRNDFRATPPLTPAPFDPNTTDSAGFRRLGLPGWMARNIVHYREKGGRFRRPEDFRWIYGLTEEQYHILRPYIRIAPEDTARLAVPRIYTSPSDTIAPDRPAKYPAGTVVELNRADTTELMRIPGIGSAIARLIVGYRQRLGGFYTLGQLEEINLNPEPLRPWLRIDTTAIRRLNLNRVSIDRLRRHPYFSFYQAKIIVERRKKHGPLRNLKAFALYEEFTPADFERQQHYICFE